MTAHTSSASRLTRDTRAGQPAGTAPENVRIDVTDLLACSVLILVVVFMAMHGLPVSTGLA